MSVGLRVGEREWLSDSAGGPAASARLLPTLIDLLTRAGIGFADLDALAFGHGPGAFTGLRTACSVAQGLGLGVCKPLLALDSLMAVAEDARGGAAAIDVAVVMDARMGEIYFAHYRFMHHRWAALAPPVLTQPDLVNATWAARPPAHIAGSALNAFAGRLHTAEATRHADALPRAAALLALAASQWSQGETIAADAALPVYVRDKVAQTSDERAAARGAASIAPVATRSR